MNHLGFILAAWIIPAVVLGLYSVRLLLRGRSLSRSVAPEQRRWLGTPGDSTQGPS